MKLKTRRVHFAGCTKSPHEAWMKQTARELTNCEDVLLMGRRHLIMDRDTNFCESFRSFLSNEGVKPVRLPTRLHISEGRWLVSVFSPHALTAVRWCDKAMGEIFSLDQMPHRCPYAPENASEELTIRMMIVGRRIHAGYRIAFSWRTCSRKQSRGHS